MTRYKRETSDYHFLQPARPEESIAHIDKQLSDILNDGLDLEDNIRGSLVNATVSTESTTVFHGLGYIPKGFLVVRQEGEGQVWADRVSEWTTEELYCKSNATSLRVALFVL